MTNEEWLEANTKKIKCEVLVHDDVPHMEYVSLVDGSYITREGMEVNVALYNTLGLTLVQNKDSNPEHTANVGFNKREQKWYGWSHRAVCGFGIGSKVEKGDCAYVPLDADDFLDDMVRFWSDPDNYDVVGTHMQEGVHVGWRCGPDIPNEKRRNQISGCVTEYPKFYGRGEWEATSLDEAREMAGDFAEGVG